MLRHYYLRISTSLASHSIWIAAIIHVVGIIGLLSPLKPYFQLLTPLTLILSAVLLWLNQTGNQVNLIRFSLTVIIMGFIVEWVGVTTGLIFGDYQYGHSLGPKLGGVPVIIGLNWLLVMYCVAALTDSLRIPTLAKIVIASLLAVAIDWLIEPVAMKLDFWHWQNSKIPIHNFIGWFFTSVAMQWCYHTFRVKAENRLALPYYFIQLFFFLVLNVILS